MQKPPVLLVTTLLAFLGACSSAAPRSGATGGEGGEGGEGPDTGGSGGQTGGSGGRSTGGQGGQGTGGQGTGGQGTGGTAGQGGTGGTGGTEVDSGAGGQGPSADASTSGGTPDSGSTGTSTPGQGPVGEGTVVFSRDFEDGSMAGLSRSPNGIPDERIQIADDPTMQRGKVMRIEYKAGDNYRTSAGTQPRSWLSSAMGYTVKQGKTVS